MGSPSLRAVLRRNLGLIDEGGHGASSSEFDHQYIGFDMMLLSYLLVLLVIMAAAFERWKLPASSGAILVGAVIGGWFRHARVHESDMLMHASFITFDEELFLYMLLPPIIFEAGFSLPKKYFFGNIGSILLFAVVGTLASTFVIGQTIYAVGGAGAFASDDGRQDALDFTTPLDSYLFGALISATDPVATLSIMGAVNADPVIYILVFGESVLNDAVAIVLVRILQSMGEVGFEEPSAYVTGIGAFFGVSVGSLLVGFVVSAASALLLKRFDLTHHPSYELSLMLLIGYSAYTTAEAAGCSGILALFTTGVLTGHYHLHSLSSTARESTGVALKAAAHLAETAVFAYMGVDIFSYTGAGVDAFFKAHFIANDTSASSPTAAAEPQQPPAAAAGDAGSSSASPSVNFEYDWEALPNESMPRVALFVFFALVIVLFARVIVVLPLCLLANRCRGATRQLSSRMMAMMVFSGLRGAIAFALAHNIESEHQGSIAAATTTIVMFTTFVLGGATRRVLKCLHMEASPSAVEGLSSDTDSEALEHAQRWTSEPADDGEGGSHFEPAGGGDGSNRRRSRKNGGRPEKLQLTRDSSTPSRFFSLWTRLDAQVLVPLFGGPSPANDAPIRAAEPAAPMNDAMSREQDQPAAALQPEPSSTGMEMMDVNLSGDEQRRRDSL